MKRRSFRLPGVVLMAGLLLALTLAFLAVPAGSQGPVPIPQPQPERLTAVRQGTWPAQVAAASGAARPDRHGPQRHDTSEGIPTHAYSPFDERRTREHPCPPGGCDFQAGQVLVKLAPRIKPGRLDQKGAWTEDSTLNTALAAQGLLRLEPLFPTARPPKPGEFVVSPQGERLPKPDLTRWYRGVLDPSPGPSPKQGGEMEGSADVYAVVAALEQADGVAWAEPDYLRKPMGEPENRGTQGNSKELGGTPPVPSVPPVPPSSLSSLALTDPLYPQQWHLTAVNAPQAWDSLQSQGLPPGGSRDIVVAVIDTGVDDTHPDLAANMWTNSREVAGNGVDDDGNGFVDDVHGANVVSNQHSGDPQDDHGHGTHVAGIIAAQANNGIGGVGVAYNAQIMALKAAQYSGVLASSDIAEAIYYAVAQGADVINMSFGGYARSQVEEDALAVAFGQAVLVAAAGNDGKVNLPCPFGRDMYPAAYNWVLGVMASTSSGGRAIFSNYDCTPHDSHEYELMAPGVDVWSTLPHEQYAAWDGTSMAAPVVAGIAALARTKWSDKDVYSSRFIMGQIAANAAGGTGGVANAYTALTVAPKPELSYLEHWLFDTADQSASNDDDGIVDAGETVDLAIVIRNHWGKADPVTVTLEAWAEGAFQPDPYVTMITGTVSDGAVGSFNRDDNGLIYDDQGVIVGVRHPFRFSVDPNTPNDHVIPFRLTMTARNGLDPADTTVYTSQSRFYLIVQRGRELPRIISQDMVLSKDYYWIVPGQTLIESGVTVTVTEGTQIQFWSSIPGAPYQGDPYPQLHVGGTLRVFGTHSSPVELFLDPFYPGRLVEILEQTGGQIELFYSKIENPSVLASHIDHSMFSSTGMFDVSFERNGQTVWINTKNFVAATTITSSLFLGQGTTEYNIDDWGTRTVFHLGGEDFNEVKGTVAESLFQGNHMNVILENDGSRVFHDNVLLNNFKQGSNGLRVSQLWMRNYWMESCIGNGNVFHNAFLNPYVIPDPESWSQIHAIPYSPYSNCLQENYWGTNSSEIIDAVIWDSHDDFSLPRIIYDPILGSPSSSMYPFVVDVTLSTAAYSGMSALHGPTPIVGAEPVTFTVTFNRDMDPTVQPAVSFGPDVPETDYTIHPVQDGWQDARTWVGTFNVTPITGDGYQFMRIAGARAAEDPWLVTGDDSERFRFEVMTRGSESMNLQATGGEGSVDLSWTQTDFELLAGFNLYRATTITGTTYTRLNTSIIPPDQRAFHDTAVQPGQPYYYKFTVVKSDMSESDFSNVAQATPSDTIPPVISHTPVTEAPPGLPLTLVADVSDNVGVQGVTLFFRTIGTPSYTARTMIRTTGNRHAATIEGSRVAWPGLEYYLEAGDGVSTVRFGRPEYPYQVAVVDRPVVTAVSPTRGPASGGTALTVAGSNFKAGATVTFGGAACSGVTVVSSSQLTCTTPAHFPATVDVTVTNPDGQSGTLLRGFTYESDTPTPTATPRPCAGDVDGSGRVDVTDLQLLAAAFRQPTYDVVGGDGLVTLLDVMVAAAQFNTSCP